MTRADCCLCDEAKAVLESVRRDLQFELILRDMDQDPDLPGEWSDELPVVLLDGRKRFKYRVEEKRLRRLLARAQRDARWWNLRTGRGDKKDENR